jgi:hypothetical protein
MKRSFGKSHYLWYVFYHILICQLTTQNPDERALGLTADPVSRTYWVYTDKSILEVLVKNEDRDVWRAKLERGDHAGALSFVKVSCSRLQRSAKLMAVCPATRYRTLETRGFTV